MDQCSPCGTRYVTASKLAKEGLLVVVVYDNRGVADGYIIVSKFMQKYDLLIRCVTVPVSVDSTFVLYIFTLLVMFFKKA